MDKKQIKAAVFSGSRNLYKHMVPAVKALLYHSDCDRVYMLIEDDKFPEPLPDYVKTINVSKQRYFKKGGPNAISLYTYMAMMRGVLSQLFPDLDRILSLDCDAFAVKDISSLWDLPIDNYYFAASREPARCLNGELYTNTGVALYNLRKIREDGIDQAIIDELNSKKYLNLEQDVYNFVCRGKIYIMPSTYNATDYTEPAADPHIIHYAGIREWYEMPEVQKAAAISWDEIRRDA